MLAKVMADPSVHFFTKRILIQCRDLDPVDALHDLELALEVWREEVDSKLKADEVKK